MEGEDCPRRARIQADGQSTMKLLVLAQTPPPVHGQSLAVEALVNHLRAQPGWEVHHVNLRLSRDATDIGRWRPGKVFSILGACVRTWATFLRHGRMAVYYVPAPGKRGALYRDWLVLALCRPLARGLILHWHAVGLGAWLDTQARPWERAISSRLLGGATLAIAQADIGRVDAERLAPQHGVVVRNGVEDPCPDFAAKTAFHRPLEVAFVGLGAREKGLLDALDGVALAHAREPHAFRFTAVGAFADSATEREFRECAAPLGAAVRHLGFVTDAERDAVLRAADIFCFPSYYPHEGQPAVLLEALAHDLPIITTRWRGIPENLPAAHIYFVDPRSPQQIADQLVRARRAGAAGGALRRHYLAHFTRARHLAALTQALEPYCRPA